MEQNYLCTKYGVTQSELFLEFRVMPEKIITDPRILAIAAKLKKLRIEKGFTSYENFALDNDLPRMQYWRMEKGTNFTALVLLKILDVHKITLSEFFKDL